MFSVQTISADAAPLAAALTRDRRRRQVPEPVCGVCAAPFTAAVALHPPPEAEALLRAALEKRKRPKRDRAASSEP